MFLAYEKWLPTLLIKEMFVLAHVGTHVDGVEAMHGIRLTNSSDNYSSTPAGQAGSLLDWGICPHHKSLCLSERGWGWSLKMLLSMVLIPCASRELRPSGILTRSLKLYWHI